MNRGQTLGVFGGGQLAQMLALAAIPLGVRVTVLEPDAHAPARLCALHIQAPYTDPHGLDELAACDAVTLEFENVPTNALASLERRVPVRPSRALLAHSKHRAREKEALQAAGVKTAPFVVIESKKDLEGALRKVGGKGILKTSELGYDGKGQARVGSDEALANAWRDINSVPCVLEGIVPFVRELSLAVACNPMGHMAFGPLIENIHRNGILRTSVYPAQAFTQAENNTNPDDTNPDDTNAAAKAIAKAVAQSWNLEGLLTLEFFQLESGELLVNEVAPRVHNSGHLTQDSGGVSQFEAQVRAVLNMPLQDWAPLLPCAMVNYIGVDGFAPDWDAIDAIDGTRIHLYHKSHRAGRKLGHVNLVAPDLATLQQRLKLLEDLIP